MQSRQLGRDGPMIHQIGFGAMSFSDFYGATNELESHSILDMTLEAGVTHIDTSNVYGMGRSETVIGSYLKANPQARDHFSIATKGGITRPNQVPLSHMQACAASQRVQRHHLHPSQKRLSVSGGDHGLGDAKSADLAAFKYAGC